MPPTVCQYSKTKSRHTKGLSEAFLAHIHTVMACLSTDTELEIMAYFDRILGHMTSCNVANQKLSISSFRAKSRNLSREIEPFQVFINRT